MDAYKRTLALFLLVGLAVLGGSIYGFYETDEGQMAEAPAAMPEAAGKITVYVCGAVNKTGVVRLDEGARVIDAVNRCGGPLPGADVKGINMAKPLKDGEQVTVPEREIIQDAALPTQGGAPEQPKGSGGSGGKININTAAKEELDRLPGIGPAMAEAIIEYRRAEGAFQSVEDLKKVRGIGEAKFQKLKDKAAI